MTTPTKERQEELLIEARKQLFEEGTLFSEKHGMDVTDEELVWMRDNITITNIR